MPSSISVQPAVGTAPAAVAVTLLPSGAAAPLHVLAGTGGPVTPATNTSAQAFAEAAGALSTVLMPKPFISQRGGTLLFGVLPI